MRGCVIPITTCLFSYTYLHHPSCEFNLNLQCAYTFIIAPTGHDSTFVEMISGRRVKRSPEGAVPHDLGDPWDEPFAAVNAYVYQARNASRMHDGGLLIHEIDSFYPGRL